MIKNAALLLLFVFGGFFAARAQVCQGSGGVSAIDQYFITGLPGKSDMNYTDSVPPRGFFSIKKSTVGLNPNWINLTASGNAQLVIINSASTQKYIYRDTIRTLCASTTYAFTADLYNLIKDKTSAANVTFVVQTADGVQQQTQYASTGGTGSEPQTGFVFATAATGGDVILSILVNPAYYTDAVLAMTNIRVQICGPRITASFSKPDILTTDAVCEGTTKTYNLSSLMFEFYDNPFYQWQMRSSLQPAAGYVDIPGATSRDYTYQLVNGVAGSYSFRLKSGRTENINATTCVSYSSPATIVVNRYPVPTASMSSPVCEGGNLTLDAGGGGTYVWTGPNNFTSTKKTPVITNLTQANGGTYYVAVTINGCTSYTNINVVINTKPVITTSANTVICKGDNTILSASGGVVYEWSPVTGLSNPNIANPIASPTTTTTYTVKAYNAAGCSAEATVTVTVNAPPTASAGPDKVTIQEKPVTLEGKITNSTNYYWTPADYLNDTHALHPTATPPFDITYTLHAPATAPCATETTDEVHVQVFKKITVPNTISPNADGVNDTWVIPGLEGYPESLTQVFNRYGVRVFQAKGYPKPWDGRVNGKVLNTGTYYYKIDLRNGVLLVGWVAVVN